MPSISKKDHRGILPDRLLQHPHDIRTFSFARLRRSLHVANAGVRNHGGNQAERLMDRTPPLLPGPAASSSSHGTRRVAAACGPSRTSAAQSRRRDPRPTALEPGIPTDLEHATEAGQVSGRTRPLAVLGIHVSCRRVRRSASGTVIDGVAPSNSAARALRWSPTSRMRCAEMICPLAMLTDTTPGRTRNAPR